MRIKKIRLTESAKVHTDCFSDYRITILINSEYFFRPRFIFKMQITFLAAFYISQTNLSQHSSVNFSTVSFTGLLFNLSPRPCRICKIAVSLFSSFRPLGVRVPKPRPRGAFWKSMSKQRSYFKITFSPETSHQFNSLQQLLCNSFSFFFSTLAF